jgi:hypothetical protein
VALTGLAGWTSTALASATAGALTQTTSTVCIGHRPQEYVAYAGACSGHDEPEIDPLSTHDGSAQDLTWTIVLPTDGAVQVDAVGPTFWIGGTVTDRDSLYGQAFLELQFYPNSIVSSCTASGNYRVTYSADVFTVCSPVWQVSPDGQTEDAAYNAMLTDSVTGGPLVMHAGDTVTDHQYVTAAKNGMHITVTDTTTGHSGTIVLNSKKHGPLMPAFDAQLLGNSLGWGIVHDAPNSLVWEIGHTGNYTTPPGKFCLPGSATKPPCDSYNKSSWAGFTPLQIKGVTFGDGSKSQGWAVVSDYGGEAEVNQYCGAANYGKPYCWYPYYAYNGADSAFTYGGNYPGTSNDFNGALQFQKGTRCASPANGEPQYCATVLPATGLPN